MYVYSISLPCDPETLLLFNQLQITSFTSTSYSLGIIKSIFKTTSYIQILKVCHNQLSLITVHTKLEIVLFIVYNIALSMNNFEQYPDTQYVNCI